MTGQSAAGGDTGGMFDAIDRKDSTAFVGPIVRTHVVTVDWADGASEADIEKALAGVEEMAASYDGISRVWLRSIKSQTKQAAFAMEFTSEQALADYAGSDAQKKWYEVYLPVRGRSVTSDITN